MTSLLGPYNSGLAVGAEGVATINVTSPIIVKGRLNSVYIKYNIDWDAVTADGDVAVNGTFTGDTDWTKGLGWTIPGTNKATAGAATATTLAAAVDPLTIGKTYRLTFTLVVTAGSIQAQDDSGVKCTERTASGTYTENFVAGGAGFFFDRVGAGTFQGTIDDVILYEVSAHYLTLVTLATTGTNLPAKTLLTVDNAITDRIVRPRAVTHSTIGANLVALIDHEAWPISDYVKITLSETMAGNSVDVWLLVED